MKRAWSSAVHTRRGRLCRPSALRESPLPPSPALAVAMLPTMAMKPSSAGTEWPYQRLALAQQCIL